MNKYNFVSENVVVIITGASDEEMAIEMLHETVKNPTSFVLEAIEEDEE